MISLKNTFYMWIKILSISIFVALITFSCNKEINTWDREEDIEVDTTTLLYSAKYISHIDTQVTLKLDIVTLNGLTSETSYAGQYYYDSVRSYANHTFDVSDVSKNSFSATSYTTVFLFDMNQSWWYTQENTGFYLRRYFETVSMTPTAKVGIASFRDAYEYDGSATFHTETPTKYFDNSWEYNINTFYDLIDFNDPGPEGSAVYSLMKIDETLDQLIAANGKTGDLSITFFSTGNFYDNEGSDQLIYDIITKALTNQIRINLVGFDYDYESPIRRLALETGGFIGSNQVGYESVSPIYDNTKKISNTEVILQNLDLLLSRKVTSHRCNLVVDIDAGQGAFTSGTTESIPVNYNGRLHTIQFTIP